MLCVGDIVTSLNGRDREKCFYVTEVDGQYARISDGRGRRLEKPKMKKMRHLRLRQRGADRVAEKLQNGEKLTNVELRRGLAALGGGQSEDQGGM